MSIEMSLEEAIAAAKDARARRTGLTQSGHDLEIATVAALEAIAAVLDIVSKEAQLVTEVKVPAPTTQEAVDTWAGNAAERGRKKGKDE